MTATGALIARHVTDLFPTQTSRFDLAQAARRGVIAPLRCVRIPPGPGVRTIAKVPLRRGEVDTEFDQEMLAELLDQLPFNLAIADLYKTRFNGVPGVVYSAGVRHAYNVAEAFRDLGHEGAGASRARRPSASWPRSSPRYERGDIDVLVNAQLLAEGWNSPRATVCMHLAPTASKRIYQQRVGRVTRRQPGKEAGIVVDFVHPATKHDDPVVTLHSLLDRDVYRGGAIVVGPVRRGRGRRLRVERRVLPVTADENRRIEVFERELWRIAVEHLDYGEQVQWAALAGARVAPDGLAPGAGDAALRPGRRAQAHLPADRGRAQQEPAAAPARAAGDRGVQGRRGVRPRAGLRRGLAARREARGRQGGAAGAGREEDRPPRPGQQLDLALRRTYTREVHEEYAVQRWPETKRLLGLLVNSSGGAHARNARRLVHAARQQDRRLSAALLAAALPHTAEAGEVINGARTRMSRKPAALARELLRNFPKGKGGKRSSRRRRKKGGGARARSTPSRRRCRPARARWTTSTRRTARARTRSRSPGRSQRAAARARARGAAEATGKPLAAPRRCCEPTPTPPSEPPAEAQRASARRARRRPPRPRPRAPAEAEVAAPAEAPPRSPSARPARAPASLPRLRRPKAAAASERQPAAKPKRATRAAPSSPPQRRARSRRPASASAAAVEAAAGDEAA